LIEKIIVIELDKMLSCVEIKSWTISYYTLFESLFQMVSIYLDEINRHTESNSILKEKVLKNDVQKLRYIFKITSYLKFKKRYGIQLK